MRSFAFLGRRRLGDVDVFISTAIGDGVLNDSSISKNQREKISLFKQMKITFD